MRSTAKLVSLICAMTIVASCFAGPLAAQFPQTTGRHLIRVGFGGGVVVPTSDAADVFKNGINGQAFVLLDPGLGVPLRMNLGYQKLEYKEALQGALTGSTTFLSGTAGFELNLLRVGPLRTYASAGLGAFHMSEPAGTSGGESESQLRFGIDGGGGLSLRLGRLEAFVEGRVQNVYTEKGAIDRKDIRSIPVTFGILF